MMTKAEYLLVLLYSGENLLEELFNIGKVKQSCIEQLRWTVNGVSQQVFESDRGDF